MNMESTSTLREVFGEVISSYTRAQAIADGVLVDLRQGELTALVDEAGFRMPFACTAEVFSQCIELTDAARRAGNDVKGRLWDLLWMLKLAIRRAPRSTDVLAFDVLVVRERLRPTLTRLVAHVGPGDDAEPVITIMFPGQD
jgi:hypothetical protein